MTLAQRLRLLGAALQNADRMHCEFCFGLSGATEFDAADEIERLTRELAEAQVKERERCAQVAERSGPTADPRWERADSTRHMWRNTHWLEAQGEIAARIRDLSRADSDETNDLLSLVVERMNRE